MNLRHNGLVIAAVALAISAAETAAQRRQHARVVDLASAEVLSDSSAWSDRSDVLANASDLASLQVPTMAPVTRRPVQAASYIGLGVLIGGLATAGAIAGTLMSSDETCMCSPIGFIPIVAVGAAIGGGVGAIVYAIKH